MSYFYNPPNYNATNYDLNNENFYIGTGNDAGYYRHYMQLSGVYSYLITNNPFPNVELKGIKNGVTTNLGRLFSSPDYKIINNRFAYSNDGASLFFSGNNYYYSNTPIGRKPQIYSGILSGFSDESYKMNNIANINLEQTYILNSETSSNDYDQIQLRFYFTSTYKCQSSNGLGRYINIQNQNDVRLFGEQYYQDQNNNIWHKTFRLGTTILTSDIGTIQNRGRNGWRFYTETNSYYQCSQISPTAANMQMLFYKNGVLDQSVEPIILTFKQWRQPKQYALSQDVYYTIPNIW